jgi:hypothetical protein
MIRIALLAVEGLATQKHCGYEPNTLKYTAIPVKFPNYIHHLSPLSTPIISAAIILVAAFSAPFISRKDSVYFDTDNFLGPGASIWRQIINKAKIEKTWIALGVMDQARIHSRPWGRPRNESGPAGDDAPGGIRPSSAVRRGD